MSKIVDDDDDDDIPQLSAHALAALNQFYAEQKERDEKISQSAQSETPVEIDLIQESWQLSQFWVSE